MIWYPLVCFGRRKINGAHQPGEDSQRKTRTRINASKTKVMVMDCAKCLPVSTALSDYEKANAFVYLGSIIEADGGSLAKI